MTSAPAIVPVTYPLKSGWKLFFWILGLVALPIVFLGVPILMLAVKAELRVSEKGLQWWWLGTRTAPWGGTFVQKVQGANTMARMMGPFQLLVDGKKLALPLWTFEGSEEVAQLLREHAGAEI